MTYADYDALERTALEREPFEHLIVPHFVRPDRFQEVLTDFPDVPGPGSHPPSELAIRGHFKALMDELQGERFRRFIEAKFDVALADRPVMYTVRGFLRSRDGAIHTDSKTKIITVLIYLNEQWDSGGGRLRLLRKPDDIQDYAVEVPPSEGTLLAFRRSDRSWHGHLPYEGRRRAVQLNWVTDQDVADREQARHRLSTRIKKIKRLIFRSAA